MSQAQAALMTSFFRKREPICPTIVPLASLQSPAPKLPHSHNPQAHVKEPQTPPNQLDEGSCLLRLRHIAVHLPNTVPLAAPSDPITTLTGDPKDLVAIQQLEEPDEHPYEWLDKALNNVCGEYVKQNGMLPLAIRRGPMGLPGLCMMLQYFIDKKFASEDILEKCINNLIDEAKKLYISANEIPKKAPLSMFSTEFL